MSDSTTNTTTAPDFSPDAGDVGFVLTSTALVWIMVPGVGYFYSGMARSKNALSLIMLCMLSVAVVSVQWWIWGFSLAFSKTASKFVGNLDNVFFINVRGDPSIASGKIPDLVFAIYQCMFAAITPALAIGSGAERQRILPTLIFIFIWSTLVYDVIACWIWNPNGWSANLGGLDFAGGTPVHISSGAAALAYCIILGKRHGHGTDEFKPHNVAHILLGTTLLWFGWFGFNGGSALSGNLRAAMAYTVTNISASVGGLTWMLLDYRLERKFSALSFCSGTVAGLVAITPGSGYVGTPAAVVFGFFGGSICNYAVKLKHYFDFDDALDVFAVHCVGGMIGNILTGIFAQKSIAFLDKTTRIDGGWLDGNWKQIGFQVSDSIAGFAYSFCVTYIILYLMDKTPGLSLRTDINSESAGLDETEMGEQAYYHVNAKLVSVDPKNSEPKAFQPEEILGQQIRYATTTSDNLSVASGRPYY
ncbi:290_t:CDS:2 [Ambispora leptoticha]|uniref:Ammonium transporter n=1 Tax=Ambispora leptoticha TaxID=144679 RepID=A0A9N9F701_9GLOM|nr:290_t:CDS:2 [Ambispora leptoticha]